MWCSRSSTSRSPPARASSREAPAHWSTITASSSQCPHPSTHHRPWRRSRGETAYIGRLGASGLEPAHDLLAIETGPDLEEVAAGVGGGAVLALEELAGG